MKAVNFWKTLFCSALALGALTGCSDDDDKGGSTGMPAVTVNGLQTAAVAVKLDGGTTSPVSIKSTGDWTLTFTDATQNWCKASKTSGGKGETQVTFAVEESTEDRETSATVTTYGSIAGQSIAVKATIIIRQNASGSTAPNTNVAEIRAKLVALGETGTITEEITAMTLLGIVVTDAAGSNAASGNSAPYYAAVQDDTDQPGAGLMLNASKFKDLGLVPGDVVSIPLTGASISYYNKVLQLKISDAVTIDVTKSGAEVPAPAVIAVDQIIPYESMLVQIDNCEPGYDFVNKAWNGNVTFETLGETPASFVVRTGSAAAFKDQLVPEKSGFVVGIASQNNGTAQVMPRTAQDFDGLTGEYKGPEYKTGTISQMAADEYWEISAAIAATYTKGFLLADNTGYTLVFNNAWNSQTDNTYTVGQKVTVKGKVAAFNGLLQFSSPEITAAGNESFDPGQATPFDAAALTAYTSALKYQYVSLTGVLGIKEMSSTTSGAYKSYTIAVEGYDAKTVTLAYAFDKDFAGVASGDVVDVTGYAIGMNKDQDAVNIMMTTIVKNTTTPAVSISTVPQEFAAAGGTQTIDFNVINAGENKVFAKVTGAGAAQFTVPAGEISGTSVELTAAANAVESDQIAELVIYLAAAENDTPVASATVDLKQAAKLPDGALAVTFDFTTLTEGTEPTTLTEGDITLTFSKGTHKNSVPKYYASGTALRMYAGNTLAVAGGTILKIEFTIPSGQSLTLTPNEGTYASGVWTGSTADLLLTIGATSRVSKMWVIYTK